MSVNRRFMSSVFEKNSLLGANVCRLSSFCFVFLCCVRGRRRRKSERGKVFGKQKRKPKKKAAEVMLQKKFF